MPLTEQEREWLERRKNLCARCWWNHCGMSSSSEKCRAFDPINRWKIDYRDASEFEARVAAKLAKYCADYWQRESAWHALKDARIEVEQEF